MQTLTLVLASCVVCMGVGVPLGIYAAHHPKFYRALTPVLDLMQTLPVFVYLIPVLVLFGLGHGAGVGGDRHFRHARRNPADGTWHPPRPRAALSEAATAFGGDHGTTHFSRWNCPSPFRRSWQG